MINNKEHKHTGSVYYLAALTAIAALGGFLFGFDTAVISGTTQMVREKFALDAVSEGWFVSSALTGCILGVATAGKVSDLFGRKKILALSGILFLISAVGCAVSVSHVFLITSRLIGGIGVGIASMLSPLYISEISPPEKRGRLVSIYQFAITIGILTAYFSNASILRLSGEILNTIPIIKWLFVDEIWRGMFATEAIPAIIFLILLLFIPESPRWLTKQNKSQKAHKILSNISGEEIAKKEISEIKETLNHDSGSIKQLFRTGFKTALIIGILLAVLSQLSGINAIIYYGPKILNEAGFTLGEAFGGQVTIGIVNVLFTIVAIIYIDKFGRKPLLIFGVSGAVIALIGIGMLFFFDITEGYLLMSFILLYIACFAFSFGPVVWVIISEIYPTRIRGQAMSIAIFALWIGTALVGQFVPILLEIIKPAGTFWLFAILCFPAIFITWKLVPETKGKSLEEIEKHWLKNKLKNKNNKI
ncbi:sugar porter family MFS transporter [Bacteroidota bacterium]